MADLCGRARKRLLIGGVTGQTDLVALALLHVPEADLLGPCGHVHEGRGERGLLQAQPRGGRKGGRQSLDREPLLVTHRASAMICT